MAVESGVSTMVDLGAADAAEGFYAADTQLWVSGLAQVMEHSADRQGFASGTVGVLIHSDGDGWIRVATGRSDPPSDGILGLDLDRDEWSILTVLAQTWNSVEGGWPEGRAIAVGSTAFECSWCVSWATARLDLEPGVDMASSLDAFLNAVDWQDWEFSGFYLMGGS